MESWGGSPPPDPLLLKAAVNIWGKIIFGKRVFFSKMTIVRLGNKAQTRFVFQNGSPGQTTLLDRLGSKFSVEPRSQNPDISHMSQKTIRKLQI